MEVPPVGVRFRIISPHIDAMLCLASGTPPRGQHNVGHIRKKINYNYSDDSWWHLEQSIEPGYYLIVHDNTDCKFYANYQQGEKGLIRKGRDQHDDQLWAVQLWNDDEFKLSNRHGNKMLFLRSHPRPNIGLCDIDVPGNRDQLFSFFYEEPTIERVTFNLSSAEMYGKIPKVLLQQTIRNSTSVDQQQTLSVAYKQMKEHNWAYTGGFKICAEMQLKFKAGLPLFGSSNISTTLGSETNHQWTTETVTSESKTMTYEFPVTVPPGKTVEAKALIHDESMSVPYTMDIRCKGSKKLVRSHGKWNGVQAINVFNEIREI